MMNELNIDTKTFTVYMIPLFSVWILKLSACFFEMVYAIAPELQKLTLLKERIT